MAWSEDKFQKLREHLGSYAHISALEQLSRSKPELVAKLQNEDDSSLDDLANLNKERSVAIEKQMKQFARMNSNAPGPRVRSGAMDDASRAGRSNPQTPTKAPYRHKGLENDKKNSRTWRDASLAVREIFDKGSNK